MKLRIDAINHFMELLDKDSNGKYSSCINGPGNLYATCYALMTKHYLGVPARNKNLSLDFILDTQEPDSGYFIGPELKDWTPPKSSIHNREHILLHLSCTVLPVLELFGVTPKYFLKFTHRFLDKKYLADWLNFRNWRNAWLEGNNLLFVGQLLVYLRDKEKIKEAEESIEIYFKWLNEQVDPKTGLWGTNGYCTPFIAMCGGYHQLLVYYYENMEIKYKKQLIDTVLALQHFDGGFNPKGGGGACEDTDAADILVNMYKMVNYRRIEIRTALRRLLKSILKKQMPDGGFVYRINEPFIHMGIPETASSEGSSNMFATWFRTHTLALISEILTDEAVLRFNWQFNNSCSMGWHKAWDKKRHMLNSKDRKKELFPVIKKYLLERVFKKEWYIYRVRQYLSR